MKRKGFNGITKKDFDKAATKPKERKSALKDAVETASSAIREAVGISETIRYRGDDIATLPKQIRGGAQMITEYARDTHQKDGKVTVFIKNGIINAIVIDELSIPPVTKKNPSVFDPKPQ